MRNYLSIEPCREGWGNMSPSAKGRFCSSCKKEVQDFSESSLDDIKKAFSENDGELCGHIPVKLLQEEHFAKHLEKGHYSHLKKFWIAAVFCFGATLFTVDAAKASTFYKIRTAVLSFAESTTGDSVIVSGMVKDRDRGNIIPFASIGVFQNDSLIVATTTDIEGRYSVKVPAKFEKVNIKAHYIGYKVKTMSNVSIAPGKLIVVDFDIFELEYIMEGAIEVQPAKKTKPKKGK